MWRFRPVYVDEPPIAQTIMIPRGLRGTLESYLKATIIDWATVAAAELSGRHIFGRFVFRRAGDGFDQ